MPNIIGPDVSFYQDDPETPQGIDFAKMKLATDFAVIRAGQNLWPDPDFRYNWTEARRAKLRRGSYWFFDSRANPKRQAELWVELLNGDLGELPLFADFEDSYGGPFTGWRSWFDFLERLKSLVGGKEIGLYTAFYYWRDNAPNPTFQASNLEYFHQYPLWIANYGVTTPSIPKPWKANEWLFWQFTEGGDGALYGVESNGIDLNYFNGDRDAFLARFPAEPPPAPPPVPPLVGGPGAKHRVTAASLRIRQGAGTSTAIIGGVKLDDVVLEIGSNSDRSWIKIQRSDGLLGWVDGRYLMIIEGATTTPPPVPVPTGKMYRVVTRLKLREGPGTTFNTLAVLDTDEIVEEIGSTTDRSWLQVKRRDGATGWCYSVYLVRTDAAPPPPPPPPPPVPTLWYRVSAASLTIREGPSTTNKGVGFLFKDDIVPGLDVSADETWIQIQRADGLTGWCHRNFLVFLGKNRPDVVRQILFTGTTYFRKQFTAPRTFAVHALTIDLRAGEFHILVTPPSDPNGILCTRKTSDFLEEFQVHIAINGDGFTYLNPPPEGLCATGDPVIPNGFAASRGKVYSTRRGPTVYINQKNEVSFDQVKGTLFNAVSGDRMVLVKGQQVPNLATNNINPRTALGLSKNERVLILVVVDGRQEGASEGVSFPELADLMVSFGAYTAINMDGGGSSALVIKGADGKPRVLNTPVDDNTPGKERSVANHLGIFIKK